MVEFEEDLIDLTFSNGVLKLGEILLPSWDNSGDV